MTHHRNAEQPRHDYRVVRPLQPVEWRDFLAAVPWIWIKAVEGDLADAPANAPQTALGLGIAADGVTIVSRGASRAVGRGSILALTPDMPFGHAGSCVTGDRSHDACTAPGVLDTRLHYAARLRSVSRRMSSGLR
ncbi:hypothetical protein E2C06_36425 [Dankookia rubra]|uniref:Uncharacterized protein n=1 Tax=Dankookia rubra TaxID=1442381 RepID=A0A4R5Q0H7_9PROT|nr:hypothetical protein [Dankookia rubra]TDH56250.1 hypothetical protein E2C06_36425 [Dankookia rubra]